MARKAITQLERVELNNPNSGAVRLTLVAALARQRQNARAKAVLAEFNAAVPGVETVSAMKKWMHSYAELAGYEPLFDGPRMTGVGD